MLINHLVNLPCKDRDFIYVRELSFIWHGLPFFVARDQRIVEDGRGLMGQIDQVVGVGVRIYFFTTAQQISLFDLVNYYQVL